nr:ABC transporter permease [Bacteroidota bacterium]
VPLFWLATLLIYFFASGEILKIFPAGGLGSYHTASNAFAYAGTLINHLFLPVLCLSVGSLAYVSRQMKQSFLHETKQSYVWALKSHGVSAKSIRKNHIIPNALFPVITIIGSSIPALLSGSLIIEVIFNIPGMGRLLYNSLLARDWPVAFPILMMAAVVTVLSYILTDVIYRLADPRVKTLEG